MVGATNRVSSKPIFWSTHEPPKRGCSRTSSRTPTADSPDQPGRGASVDAGDIGGVDGIAGSGDLVVSSIPNARTPFRIQCSVIEQVAFLEEMAAHPPSRPSP